jgi:hypothetical protein
MLKLDPNLDPKLMLKPDPNLDPNAKAGSESGKKIKKISDPQHC